MLDTLFWQKKAPVEYYTQELNKLIYIVLQSEIEKLKIRYAFNM
jgi:hypothetical protein